VCLLSSRQVAETYHQRQASVAQDLLAVSRIDGYGFDLELLYVAQRRGYQIAEVPINWADQPGSKVRVLRDGLRMFCELLAVKRNDKAGRYHKTIRFDCKTCPAFSLPGIVNLPVIVTDVQVVRLEEMGSKGLRGKCSFMSPPPSQMI